MTKPQHVIEKHTSIMKKKPIAYNEEKKHTLPHERVKVYNFKKNHVIMKEPQHIIEKPQYIIK